MTCLGFGNAPAITMRVMSGWKNVCKKESGDFCFRPGFFIIEKLIFNKARDYIKARKKDPKEPTPGNYTQDASSLWLDDSAGFDLVKI